MFLRFLVDPYNCVCVQCAVLCTYIFDYSLFIKLFVRTIECANNSEFALLLVCVIHTINVQYNSLSVGLFVCINNCSNSCWSLQSCVRTQCGLYKSLVAQCVARRNTCLQFAFVELLWVQTTVCSHNVPFLELLVCTH